MELTYDWGAFQDFFQPSRRPNPSAAGATGAASSPTIHVVAENDIVVAAFGEPEDFSTWIGSHRADLASAHPGREVVVHERAKLDEILSKSIALPHYHEQQRLVRDGLSGSRGALKTGAFAPPSDHFLLTSIEGWWTKVLPSAYGVLIRISGAQTATGGAQERDLFLLVRRGKLEAFHEPDLSSMGAGRARMPSEVVKYLSEKHLVPVQGLVMPAHEWSALSESRNPWAKLFKATRAKRAKLVPMRPMLLGLAAARAFARV